MEKSWYEMNSLRMEFFLVFLKNLKTIEFNFNFESEFNDLIDEIFLIIKVLLIYIYFLFLAVA